MSSILVIEDSAFTRRKICHVLTSMGHQVAEADNGCTGLELAQNTQPDVIFLDLLMPEMDGIEVLKQLQIKNIQSSVIVLSADVQETTRQECLSLGASHCLGKPPKSEELVKVLNDIHCLA